MPPLRRALVDKAGVEPTFHDIVERVPESLLTHINQVDWLGLHRGEALLPPLCVSGTWTPYRFHYTQPTIGVAYLFSLEAITNAAFRRQAKRGSSLELRLVS